MATVSKVTLRGGFTVNMGNYESARIEAEVEVQLNDGDTTEEGFKIARDLIDKEVGTQMTSLKKLEAVKNKADGRIISVVKLGEE